MASLILVTLMVLTPEVSLEVSPALVALLPDAEQGAMEAKSAVPLLLPHLEASSVEDHVALLVVVGEAGWLDAFLEDLPPVALILSLRGDSAEWAEDWDLTTVPLATGIILVAEDNARALSTTILRLNWNEVVRTLFWTSTTQAALEKDLKLLMKDASKVLLETRLAVSISNGTTVLHEVRPVCGTLAKLCLTSICTPFRLCVCSRWWQGGGALFEPPCFTWRPPPSPGPPELQIDFTPSLTMRYVADKILATMSNPDKLPHRKHELSLDCEDHWVLRARSCSLDALVSPLPVRNTLHQGMAVFSWAMSHPHVVVPAALGRSPHGVLFALTHEFSAGVWNLLVLSLLSVAATLYVIRGGPLEVVLLQALSPTLAQCTRVRDRRDSLRLLLGCWMLVSTVLLAAYNGKLLSELTVAHPPAEMDLFQLAESDLRIFMTDSFYLDFYGEVEPLKRRRGRGVYYRPHFNYTSRLPSFAEGRKSALLMSHEWKVQVDPWTQEPNRKLHMFKLPNPYATSLFITSKGSPLERPIRKYHGILLAAGLVQFWFDQADDMEQRRHNPRAHAAGAYGPAEQAPRLRPHHSKREATALRLANLFPAFIVLTAGHIAALVTFILEKL